MRTRIALCAGVALGVLGCGDDAGPVGRGSAACNDFQDALCDFSSDRCGVLDRGTCDDSVGGIECTTDSAASACANALNDARCGVPVTGCDLRGVIDSAPAIARCNQLIDLVCQRAVNCGQLPSVEACSMQVTAMVGFGCQQAASASLRFEECVAQIEKLSCAESTPMICNRVIGVIPNLGM